MKEYFTLPPDERKKIKDRITTLLKSHQEIIFAYLYGSFLGAPSFRDIDIAVCVDEVQITPQKTLDYELQLGAEIILPYPLDVRLLNAAPFGFQNNVLHSGELLFSRDDAKLSDMLEHSSIYMLNNASLIRESLAALVS